MNVILKKDIDNLGSANEVVEVKSGYARNYLIPKKYAVEASISNLKHLKSIKKGVEITQKKLLDSINILVSKMKESPVTLKAKVGTSGKIFGNITTVQIAREIKTQKGFEVNRKRIKIINSIESLGVYPISIDFDNDTQHEFDIEIIAEE